MEVGDQASIPGPVRLVMGADALFMSPRNDQRSTEAGTMSSACCPPNPPRGCLQLCPLTHHSSPSSSREVQDHYVVRWETVDQEISGRWGGWEGRSEANASQVGLVMDAGNRRTGRQEEMVSPMPDWGYGLEPRSLGDSNWS